MKHLSANECLWLLKTLEMRFDKHPNRHPGLNWIEVAHRLRANADKLRSLYQMEQTGGEPDVVGRDPQTGGFIFFDCAGESPSGRRSLSYDRAARESRKNNPPSSSAVEMAAAMGVELLTEYEYCQLQQLGEFDTKTSSWLQTPPEIRRRGGALFGDRRYGRTFIYHNGAESYFTSRGFRAKLII
ncbi:MAG: DUF4256 domain-containing protein [Verrucomicrobiae bacterium]|nr:DUF4256 domain-containing protein [Verrucomicrobiae bacterium]